MTEHRLPSRKHIRLRDLTYRDPGAYFVTVCVLNSRCIFGEIENDEMVLNDFGRIADRAWRGLHNRWPGITIDDYHVVMPNHVHGIVVIEDLQRDEKVPRLGDIVARFKANVTSTARRELLIFDSQIWLQRFNDHVVRDEAELLRIRQYIANNPAQWSEDEYYGLR